MTNWITCPGCGLKHSPRPDGLCPRCRTRTGAASAPPGFAPPQPMATQPFPPAPPPLDAAPLPTTEWGGGAPTAATAPRVEITVGSLVSRTFATWRANMGKFAVVLVLAYVPIFVAGVAGAIATGASRPREELIQAIVPFLIVGGLASMVLFLAWFGGVIFASLQHLAGRQATVGEMFRVGFRRAWPLFLASFVATLLITLGLIALVVPGIILLMGLMLVYPIAVAEEQSVGATLKRSFALSKGSRGTILGAIFVLSLAIWAVAMVGNVATLAASSSKPIALVLQLLSFAAQVAMTPLTTVLCAVAYHDLRVAKEGVDTSQLARVFE